MACAYSQDLRDRVIEAAGNGTSARKAAARFEVGVSTALKWLGRVRDSGERSARRPGRRPGSKLDPHRDFLLAAVEAEPDSTIGELQRRLLGERGVYASTGTIWTFLDRCDLTFKKKSAHAAEQNRPDVREEREEWFEGSSTLIRRSWSSSTRALRPPTWRAGTAARQEARACALRSRTAIVERPRSWRGCACAA